MKIILIGCGWAGSSFLKNINSEKYDVTLISLNSNFIYTPYIVDSIFKEKNINYDARKLNKFNYIEGNVNDINFEENKISLFSSQMGSKEIKYDYLVLAHGSSTNTFNIPGVDENCLFLKDNNDLDLIKEKLKNLKFNSNIAVIGCGLTGSDLIGNLIDYKKFNIYAIDGLKLPLSTFNNYISNSVIDLWKNNNVNLLFNNFVKKLDNKKIYFKDKEINYDLVFWCGGIKPSKLSLNINKKLFLNCKFGIPVNKYLLVNNTKNVYAIGDCGYNKNPQTAQVAYQEGEYLAKNFNKDILNQKPFTFSNKGQISYVGDGKSVYQNNYFYGHGKIYTLIGNFINIYNAISFDQSLLFLKNMIRKD